MDETKVSEIQKESEKPAEKSVEDLKAFRGRLLPIWIKIFCWFFLFMSAGLNLMWMVGSIGNGQLTFQFFGVTVTGEASDPYLLAALGVFMYAGALAWGLLWKKKWAPLAGIIWGFLIGALCVLTTVLTEFRSIRLELIPLIFFTAKMVSIKYDWEIGPYDD